jgi:hypothetical protein
MCCEKFLIYARCAHPKSSMGIIYHCPYYLDRGRICVNNQGLTFKDYEFIIEDARTECFLEGQEVAISGGWKTEIALGYKGYCINCVEGRMQPRTESEREDFLDGYLGEHDKWDREKQKRKKLAAEQERLMERFKKEKGDTSEAWTEAE